MELEASLGKKLFVRGKRRITLTNEGMLLRKRAEEIVSLVEKTAAELQAPEEAVGGDIYFGAGETDAMRLIAQVLKELQDAYPNIRCHLFSGNADDVTERLDKGLLDFGLLIEYPHIQKYNSIRLPAADVWGVLMRKDSPLAALEKIRPDDLADMPLIVSKQALESRELSAWFKKDLETLNVRMTYNLIYNASLMVQEGLGCALCLDKLLSSRADDSLCFRPLEPKLEAGLFIVRKKYQIFSKAAELFLQKIEEAFPAGTV